MNRSTLIVLVGIFLVALAPRTMQLGAFLSPDEPRWLLNTQEFVLGLKSGDLSRLYQQPHPGVTTMWLASPVIEYSWAVRRLPAAIAISFLLTATTTLMMQLWGRGLGGSIGFLLAINPIFIAHSRVLAMDALLSIFLLLSIVALLLWWRDRKQWQLAISAVSGGLAVLSKIVGVIIFPYTIAIFTWFLIFRQLSLKRGTKSGLLWLIIFFLTIIIGLPTIVVDFERVAQGTQEFFATEHYSQTVHALGPLWYPQALLIWTTPLHWLGLLLLPTLVWSKWRYRRDVVLLFLFAAVFFLTVQYSIKKGDRYLLPDFLIFDVITVLSISAAINFLYTRLTSFRGRTYVARGFFLIIFCLVVWQVMMVVTLHPYTLAYRNPLWRPIALGRTMGWGEGLDLAAQYLNSKPQVEQMLVAAYYEGPFSYRFKGHVTSAERLAKETISDIGADYVVLYRTMIGRDQERWETKVLAQFSHQEPEHVVVLNGEDYAWIYNTSQISKDD